jgi:hypothetical protein
MTASRIGIGFYDNFSLVHLQEASDEFSLFRAYSAEKVQSEGREWDRIYRYRRSRPRERTIDPNGGRDAPVLMRITRPSWM